MADRRLIALQRAARRPLAAPAEPFEEPPDVARMVADVARLLDQLPDAPRRPQTRVEAERLGPALEATFNPPQLRRRQPRLAPRTAGKLQARSAADEQLSCPPVDRLPMHPDLPRDLRLAHALPQQRRRAQSPRFQRREIPPHPRRIPHADRLSQSDGNVTIL